MLSSRIRSWITVAVGVLGVATTMLTGGALRLAHGQTGASVQIQPNGISIPVGQTRLFTATVYNNSGSVVTAATVSWAIAPGAGVVLSTGPLTASVRVGTTAGVYADALTAMNISNGLTGKASYTVTAGPLATIRVEPPVDTLTVGTTREFGASGFDAYDNPIPNLSVTWHVQPEAGSIASTSAALMTFQAGTTPGLYTDAVEASNGSIAGTADVLLQAGPPATVVVTPSLATVDINATQLFEAAVYDKYNNALPLGVTWLAQGGTKDVEGDNSVLYRAGTVAGAFPTGLIAANGNVQRVVPITVPAGPPQRVNVSANPLSLRTDGRAGSTIVANVVDAYGNATGAGTQVTFVVEECAGQCDLAPRAGTADAQGAVASTLRSTYTSPTQPLASQIKVTAEMRNGSIIDSDTTTVTGNFVPFKQFVPVTLRTAPFNNHASCLALPINPPAAITQPPNQLFNLYRFIAIQNRYTVALRGYTTTGRLLLYRVTSDQCALNNTVLVTFIAEAPITSTAFQTTFNDTFVPGATYLLAVNTTGAMSNQPYTITIQP